MVTFDGANKLIICDDGTVSLSVKAMYSMWKEWMLISDNSKYPQAFRVVGGDPTVGNNIITPYFFLLNGWKIRPQEANHTLEVDGILLTDDSSDAFVDTLGTFRVGINKIVPIYTETVLVGSGSGGLTTEESSKLMSLNNYTSLHNDLDSYVNKSDWKSTPPTATENADAVWSYSNRNIPNTGLTDAQNNKLMSLENSSMVDTERASRAAVALAARIKNK